MDWAKVQQEIEQPARQLKRYSYQMLTMSRNIGYMVAELSREEIVCRREKKQTRKHQLLLEQINTAIKNYEQYITFAVLVGG